MRRGGRKRDPGIQNGIQKEHKRFEITIEGFSQLGLPWSEDSLGVELDISNHLLHERDSQRRHICDGDRGFVSSFNKLLERFSILRY